MTRVWFPEAHYMPYGGGYLPLHRWYVGDPYKLLPGPKEPYPTVTQAKNAARDYMAALMASRMRSEAVEAPEPADALGVDQWHQERAGRAAAEQERALGALIVKGRQIQVERRKIA